MAKTIKKYIKSVSNILKDNGVYNTALDDQIRSLACSLRTLDLANEEINTLSTTTVWEETRYGKKLAPHPVFKIQKDAQDAITRQMKFLGLTPEKLKTDAESDPLFELTQKIISDA